MLWGGQCPFVISKTAEETGQWVLKGECFVEGWMEGEGVERLVGGDGREDVVFEFL